ncbi:hypothetical protein F1559_002598 [Cyanidiococcus yangmingshanensis]|uniref:Uncharacterized protein n=1 Tax=Cyanidiococcus yangmingshanensis TaxID=2690220 RepID=A0A7J7ICI7_9RHOD|nr:hypothetical protein F1559_002598 [Cyanidiococcus yangmingshanensis]
MPLRRTLSPFQRTRWQRPLPPNRFLFILTLVIIGTLAFILRTVVVKLLRPARPGETATFGSGGVSTALGAQPGPIFAPTRFLTYAAHSGLANQFMELVSAFDVARVLNRTLVIPPVLPHFAIKAGSCEQAAPVASASFLRRQNRRIWEQLVHDQKYVSFGDLFDLSGIFDATPPNQCRLVSTASPTGVVSWEATRCTWAGAVEAQTWLTQPERNTWHWPYTCHEVRLVVDVPHGILTCAETERPEAPAWAPHSAYAATWRAALQTRHHAGAPLPLIHGVCEMLHAGVDHGRALRDEPVIALGSVFHLVNYAGTLAPWTGGWQAEQLADALLRRALSPLRRRLPGFICVHLRGGDGQFRKRIQQALQGKDAQAGAEMILSELGIKQALRGNRQPVLLVTDLPRPEAVAIQQTIRAKRLAPKVLLSQILIEEQLRIVHFTFVAFWFRADAGRPRPVLEGPTACALTGEHLLGTDSSAPANTIRSD